VFDDDMIAYARSLRARGVVVPDIARKPQVRDGRKPGVPVDAGPGLAGSGG
jgi:hypothetical protein